MPMTCKRCGRSPKEVPAGIWFQRVNAKGIPGEFECRPSCAEPLPTQGDAVAAAVLGGSPSPEPQP